MSSPLTDYYRCPENLTHFKVRGDLSQDSGYFRFGADDVCFGRTAGTAPASSAKAQLHDVMSDIRFEPGATSLPFDPTQVVDSLRLEQYRGYSSNNGAGVDSLVRSLYYFVRPLLPVSVRKHLQKARLNGWRDLAFPRWPVDRTVDNVLERLLLLSMKANKVSQMPFIWFWPDGASGCFLMTHDVETIEGRDFTSTVMDINDSFGIKASFQVVPERRYPVPESYLDSIRKRGHELNVQDLNHDGHLFSERKQFLSRAEKINAYGRQYGAEGFRSAVLYRRQSWFDALQFSYDMSVPNVAHLDPQHGGCCTVMPYFVGGILELPVTMTQDYSLFHILNEYSLDLWKRQIALVLEKHGLANFIIHPDYITQPRERAVYEALLGYMVRLRSEQNIWIPVPREVNRWWRQRAEMRLVEDSHGWHIEGEGSERAHIAYASEQDGHLVYNFEPAVVARHG
ncbi:MAG TPA: hypothetical protein VH088_15640 [Terriglobales bacterium]|jgi:hypothetical protein|nr:hypothetical protein [Terriglobales bacterium]